MWPPFWILAPPSVFWPPLLLHPGDGPAFAPPPEKILLTTMYDSLHATYITYMQGSRRTIPFLFLRFVLTFKYCALENITVLISKKCP